MNDADGSALVLRGDAAMNDATAKSSMGRSEMVSEPNTRPRQHVR
jgi:hypothetical protein